MLGDGKRGCGKVGTTCAVEEVERSTATPSGAQGGGKEVERGQEGEMGGLTCRQKHGGEGSFVERGRQDELLGGRQAGEEPGARENTAGFPRQLRQQPQLSGACGLLAPQQPWVAQSLGGQ